MPGEKGFLSLLVVALVAGTAYYVPNAMGGPPARSSSAALAQGSASGSASAAAVNGPRREDAISLLAEHFGITTGGVDDTLESPRVASRLSGLGLPAAHMTLEFLVATVPDPIDSNARWQFDPIYDSIQRAVSARGYSLDRFYIPDWDPTRNPDAGQRTAGDLHERLPGVVLFRRNGNEFLAVLLVFETATGGVHPIALRRAMLTVAEWSAACRATPRVAGVPCSESLASNDIRILGPVFSGSIPSIGDAIDVVHATYPGVHFRIVTGAATSEGNQALLQTAARGAFVSYRATVLTDQQLLQALSGFLVQHVDRGRMAVLVESNTAYGESLRSSLLSQHGNTLCRNGCTVLPFPLHISRLRGLIDSAASLRSQSPTARRGTTLALDEPSNASDQVPSMAPGLTSSSTDVALSQILNTIQREDVALIGLFATDARDKLFLAQQIMLQSPNALLFTTDGDLLFTHPDYVPYTRGMIIASSYPLFTGTQLWKPTATGANIRQQFVSANAQGIYNAALALVAYGANGQALAPGAPVPLIDYQSQPSATGPYAWMSAVGRSAILPIERVTVACAGCWVYTNQVSQAPENDDRPVHATASMTVLFIAMQAFVGWCAWKRSTSLLHDGLPDARWNVGRTWRAACEVTLILAQYGTLLVLEAHNVVMREYAAGSEAWLAWAMGTVATNIAATLWLALVTLTVLRHGHPLGQRLRSVPREQRLRYIAARTGLIAPFVVAVAAIALLPQLTGAIIGEEPLPTLNRGLQLFSGLSPFGPVMVLLVAVYGWSWAHEIRARTPTLARVHERELDSLAVGGFIPLARKAAAVVESVDARSTFALLLMASIIGWVLLAFIGHVQTIEGVRFDAFFLSGWVLLQAMLIASLLSHLRMWRAVKNLLKGLSVHPIVPAFDRVPRELFAKRLPGGRPRLVHLRHAVNAHAAMLAAQAAAPAAAVATAGGTAFQMGDEARKLVAEITGTLPAGTRAPDTTAPSPLVAMLEHELRKSHQTDVARSKTWRALTREAAAVVPQLGLHPGSVMPAWQPQAETFVAITIGLMVRELAARVVRGMHVIFGAMLALVVYEISLRAYPRGLMLGLTWMYVAAGVVLALATIISAERDIVLSKLAGTTPGKIQWDAVFVTRTLIPLLFAVFTLLATQFPSVGNALLGWLRPVQTAIP